MPAPDYETIYSFEDAIEAAVQTVLNAAGLKCYFQREIISVTTPYVAIQFVAGAATEHYAAVAGDYRPDIWGGSLHLQVVTDRTNNNLGHGLYRSQVRKLMAVDATFKNAVLLPYHEVFFIMESGTTPAIRTEDDLDVSTLSYTVKFGIRAGQWPV